VRGGRPADPRIQMSESKVPPRARRSAPRLGCPPHDTAGSAACAEVGPGTPLSPRKAVGFLRVRGGRPRPPPSPTEPKEVPPRARRSARECPRVGEVDRGSSACAEVGPTDGLPKSSMVRFLRVRGGRPLDEVRTVRNHTVPPRARRSARLPVEPELSRAVSSACAEVGPHVDSRTCGAYGFLRVRGGRPGEDCQRHPQIAQFRRSPALLIVQLRRCRRARRRRRSPIESEGEGPGGGTPGPSWRARGNAPSDEQRVAGRRARPALSERASAWRTGGSGGAWVVGRSSCSAACAHRFGRAVPAARSGVGRRRIAKKTGDGVGRRTDGLRADIDRLRFGFVVGA
jgi:hypothetical protein